MQTTDGKQIDPLAPPNYDELTAMRDRRMRQCTTAEERREEGSQWDIYAEVRPSVECRGHPVAQHYCAAKCLECGWGGCGCQEMHCCCSESVIDARTAAHDRGELREGSSFRVSDVLPSTPSAEEQNPAPAAAAPSVEDHAERQRLLACRTSPMKRHIVHALLRQHLWVARESRDGRPHGVFAVGDSEYRTIAPRRRLPHAES